MIQAALSHDLKFMERDCLDTCPDSCRDGSLPFEMRRSASSNFCRTTRLLHMRCLNGLPVDCISSDAVIHGIAGEVADYYPSKDREFVRLRGLLLLLDGWLWGMPSSGGVPGLGLV